MSRGCRWWRGRWWGQWGRQPRVCSSAAGGPGLPSDTASQRWLPGAWWEGSRPCRTAVCASHCEDLGPSATEQEQNEESIGAADISYYSITLASVYLINWCILDGNNYRNKIPNIREVWLSCITNMRTPLLLPDAMNTELLIQSQAIIYSIRAYYLTSCRRYLLTHTTWLKSSFNVQGQKKNKLVSYFHLFLCKQK